MKPSEMNAVVAVIDPDANAAGTITSAWVAAKSFHSLMGVVAAGTLGTAATLDFKLQQATDASGTGAKDISGKAVTQLTQAGGDSDKQAIIDLLTGELDVKNGFSHVAMVMVTAVATSDSSAMLIGAQPRYAPASDDNAATVSEVV